MSASHANVVFIIDLRNKTTSYAYIHTLFKVGKIWHIHMFFQYCHTPSPWSLISETTLYMNNINCIIHIMTIALNRVHICYCTKCDTDLNKSTGFFLNPICIMQLLILYYLLMYLYCTNEIKV